MYIVLRSVSIFEPQIILLTKHAKVLYCIYVCTAHHPLIPM